MEPNSHGRIAFGKPDPDGATVGALVSLGDKEIEVERSLSKEDFLSGQVFGQIDTNANQSYRPAHSSSSVLTKKFVPLKPVSSSVIGPSGMQGSTRPNVSLESVNLLEKEENMGKAEQASSAFSYWTAHWYAACIELFRRVRLNQCSDRRKRQNKKHKTWDGDGYVILVDKKLTLVSEDGRV